VRRSTIVSNHHTRGGHIRFIDSVISDREDHPTGVRLLYQPFTENYDPVYMYEFENSTLGPYAEFEFTDDNITCEFRGELEMLVSPELIHWFGGTVTRKFPITVLNENGAPVAGARLELTHDNQRVWEGETDENGCTALTLLFGKDNYNEEFKLKCHFENTELQTTVGFFSSTSVLLGQARAEEVSTHGGEGIELWEITQALAPTQFLIVLGVFFLTLRAQRRRKRRLDVFGMHLAWVLALFFWFPPIYDTVIGPLAVPDMFGGGMVPQPWFVAYSIFPFLITTLFYSALYLWKSDRRFHAIAYLTGIGFYTSIVFDYHQGMDFLPFLRHPIVCTLAILFWFAALLWMKTMRRRCIFLLFLVTVFVVGNCISGVAFGRGL